MTTDCILIPVAALDDPAFSGLPLATRLLLIELYRHFGDCERFSVDLNAAEVYDAHHRSALTTRISALINAGLLIVEQEYVRSLTEPKPRVFRFKYVVEACTGVCA